MEILKPVTDSSFEDIIKTTSVNIISPIMLFQACHPHLKRAKGFLAGRLTTYEAINQLNLIYRNSINH